ncbi:hypothetical protein D6C13_24825 [Rahnella woolbedingensis]|uniref:Bacterial Ig-like domain-containing protein n=1 Tax=Rahnella woolbedingensis TaxID=1510574 RepID=A0A419N1S0_9GAMM|nr:hypothetical protein D6C13_24825 [Rahnella woolbedingensis]
MVTIDVPDTTPPDAPVITEVYDDVGTHKGPVANGGKTDDSQPLISGTAEKNSVVTVKVHSAAGHDYTLGSVVTDNAGHWSYQLHGGQDITNGLGDWTFTAQAKDAAGNKSGWSAGYTVETVGSNQDDTTAPDTPVITAAIETYDNGHTTGVTNGDTIDDNTPELIGDAAAGSVVTIYDGAVVIGSVTADSKGTWFYDIARALADGRHTFTVTATNAAGNTSSHSGEFVLNVDAYVPDTTPPDAPVITDYYDDVGDSKGHESNGSTTDDTTPTLNGQAEANSIVKVYEGSTLLGSTTAHGDGTWSFTPSARSEGKHTFFATATDAAGNTSTHSSDFVVDVETAPVLPAFGYYEDNYQAYNTLHGGNGTGYAFFNDATPTLHGTGKADSVVNIYRESYAHSNYVLTCVGSAQADASGNWSFTDSVTRSAHYSWRIVPLDHAGHEINEGATVTPDLWIADEQDTNYSTSGNLGDLLTPPEFNYFEDNYQAYNTLHGSNGTGFALFNDATPTLHGTGQADSVVNIYRESYAHSNYVLTCVGSAQADASGNWSFTDSVTRSAYYSWRIVPLDHAGHEINEGATVTPDLLIADEQDTNYSTSGNPGDLLTTTQHEAAALLATTSDLQADHAVINLHNNAVQTLYLTLNDILSEAHPNLFIQDGHQQLAVTGDQGDVVELKVNDLSHNTWQDSGAVTAGGIQYEVYQHAGSDVELLVQHGLELHQVS